MAQQPPKTYSHISRLSPAVAASIRAAKAAGGRINGLSTGFPRLDQILDGLRNKTLTVIGARPKQGKTLIATSITRNIARHGGVVYFASMEMPTEEIIKRLVAIEADVAYEKLSRGLYDDEEAFQIEDAFMEIERWPLLIDDGRTTIANLATQAAYAVKADGAQLVVVDYLQYILPNKPSSRYESVTEISMGLAEMRKSLATPIVALAQLSRKTAERATEVDFARFNAAASRPRDSDLRESGQIEQDADALLFLNRPEVYLEDCKPFDNAKIIDWEMAMQKYRGRAEIIVHFNRSGRRGIIDFNFKGPMMHFTEVVAT